MKLFNIGGKDKMSRNLFKEKQDKENQEVKKDLPEITNFPDAPKKDDVKVISENEIVRQQLEMILHNQAIIYNAILKFAKDGVGLDLTLEQVTEQKQ